MYELKPIPAAPTEGDFITRPEFEAALTRIGELLSTKVTKAAAGKVTSEPPQDYKEVF
jgi:hypothetical protein